MKNSTTTIMILLLTFICVAVNIQAQRLYDSSSSLPTSNPRRNNSEFSGSINTQSQLSESEIYTGFINICFNADAIGSTLGEIILTRTRSGIIETQFEWFNEIANLYQITEMARSYTVKDTEWNLNGQYPSNVFRIKLDNNTRNSSLINTLSRNSNILWAELEVQNRLTSFSGEETRFTPNDPLINNLWYLQRIQAFEAWDIQTGSPNVLIGISDSGVKWNHPDLQGNIWVNEAKMTGMQINWSAGTISGPFGSTGNQTSGGANYWGDVVGWNFWEPTATTTGFQNNNSFQNYSGNIHGTHVAGTAAAVGNNGVGITGVAFTSKIVPTKHMEFNYQGTDISLYYVYNSIYYLADLGVQIINCSWGGTGNANVSNLAVSYAKSKGSLVIAAAGNDDLDSATTLFYPAAATDALAVMATGSSDSKAWFSNYGTVYGISAPGEGIYSTAYDTAGNNSYANNQGTSMSAPVVSGVAALVKSQNPNMSVDDLIYYLKAGSDPIDHLNPGYAGKLGSGRVNAFNSVNLVANPLQNDIRARTLSGPVELEQNTSYTFQVGVQNLGTSTASGYTVNLMRVGNTTPLTSIPGVSIAHRATHVFNINWTPQISGSIQLYAQIVWSSDQNQNNNSTHNYNVNISGSIEGVVIFEQGFEGTQFPPSGWTRTGFIIGNWARTTQSFMVNTGIAAARSESYSDEYEVELTPDNWLITPQISLPANNEIELSFFRATDTSGYGAENYTVYISTTGNATSNFTTVLYNERLTYSGSPYARRSVNLSNYAGQNVHIAFRHHDCTGEYWLALDDVKIVAAPEPVTETIFEQGFEGTLFPPSGWTRTGYIIGNWARTTQSVMVNTGIAAARSESYSEDYGVNLTPDNWLITPQISLPSGRELSLRFYRSTAVDGWGAENYTVYISTTGNAVSNFTTAIYNERMPANGSPYTERTINISDYAGQSVHFAFRHHDCVGQDWLALDDVRIVAIGEPAPELEITEFPWLETFTASQFPPEGWKALDQDNDGNNWYRLSRTGNIFVAASDSYVIDDDDWDVPLYPNNYLITPKIVMPAAAQNMTLKFSVGTPALNLTWARENYSVMVSTTGTAPANFTAIHTERINYLGMQEREFSLSAYANQNIYIAFRHFDVEDMTSLFIDDVWVGVQLPPLNPPQNLQANVNIYTVNLSWNAPSPEPTGYRISRGSTLLTTNPITLTSFQDNNAPLGVHTYSVVAVYSQGDSQPATTTANVVGVPDAENQYVGNPTSSTVSDNFINYYYHDSLSQTIYLSSELSFGTIYQMTVRFTGNNAITNPNIPVRLYLATTTQSSFANASSWVPFNQFTLVFEGNLPVNRQGSVDINIPFDTPFEYTTNNLVVLAYKDHNAYFGGTDANAFQTTSTAGQSRTIHWRADSTPGTPPTNPFPSTSATDINSRITNANFLIIPSAPVPLAPPVNLQASVNGQNVNLTWEAPTGETMFTHTKTAVSTNYGTNSSTANNGYRVAHRYDAQMLQDLGVSGNMLTKVSFFSGVNLQSGTHRVVVWVVPSLSNANPQSPHHTITVGAVPSSTWIDVELPTPIMITPGNELLIGFEAFATLTGSSFHPLATDEGPVVSGYGDLNVSGSSWSNLNQNRNFMIRGYASVGGRTLAFGTEREYEDSFPYLWGRDDMRSGDKTERIHDYPTADFLSIDNAELSHQHRGELHTLDMRTDGGRFSESAGRSHQRSGELHTLDMRTGGGRSAESAERSRQRRREFTTTDMRIDDLRSVPTSLPQNSWGRDTVHKTPTRNLIGYHVFRGNTQLTSSPISNLFFTDSNVPFGTYTYQVIAVYTHGNSHPASVTVTIHNPIVPIPYAPDFNVANLAAMNWTSNVGPYSALGNFLSRPGLLIDSYDTPRPLWVQTPLVGPTSANTHIEFEFLVLFYNWEDDLWYFMNSLDSGESIEIKVSTQANPTVYTSVHLIDSTTDLGTETWKVCSVQLNQPVDQIYHFRIEVLSPWDDLGIYITDFKIVNKEITPLTPVTDLVANLDGNDIVLNWNINSTQHTGFRVFRGSNLLTSNPITVTTYRDINPASDVLHSYSVVAVYPSGEAEAVSISIVKPLFNPPRNLQATNLLPSVSLYWQAPLSQNHGTLSHYRIMRRIQDTGSWFEIHQTENNNILSFIDNTTLTNISYYYYVTAVYTNPEGESVPSNIVGPFITYPIPLAAINPVPSNNAINVPVTQILDWSMPSQSSETTGYRLYFGTTNPPPLLETINSPLPPSERGLPPPL